LRLGFTGAVACEFGRRGKIGAARDRRLDWVADGPGDANMKINRS